MIKIPKLTEDIKMKIEENHWTAVLGNCFDDIVEGLFKNKYNEELESLSKDKLKIINDDILGYKKFKIRNEWIDLRILSYDILGYKKFKIRNEWIDLRILSYDIIAITNYIEEKKIYKDVDIDRINEINEKIRIKKEESKKKKELYMSKWPNGIIKTFCLANKEKLDLIVQIFPKSKRDDYVKTIMLKQYKKFRGGWTKWGAVQLTEDLGLKVCPYCNRNYLIQYKNDKSDVNITAQIDHFYDKSTYPILALSLYNLIPSCPTCNHLKGTKDGILYPYETGFDDKKVVFEVDSEEIAFKIKPEEENFNIILKNKEKCKEVEKAIKEVFYLEEMYKEHKSDVVDIFYKSRIFNKKYIKNLEEMLGEGSEKDINDIIESYEGNPKDYHKKPLAKLNYDIRNQIKSPNSQKT